MSELPTQPSLRRLKQFEVRPKRVLGQNFLIDSNILEVIAREADLGADDVVLEVGGGLGVLSEHLAARARHVHVVELDRHLEPALRDATERFGNVTLHFADAVKLDHAALQPPPGKVIANLPYNVAATVILQTVADLPGVTRWVAMVQREVGERLAAAPGTPAYGAPSVLAQLSCRVRVLRPVARTVFHPVPNVDSVLVGLERTAPPAPADVRRRRGRRALQADEDGVHVRHRVEHRAGHRAQDAHAAGELREHGRRAVGRRPGRRRQPLPHLALHHGDPAGDVR